MGDRLTIGSTVAGYRIDAWLARGGMGIVYRATHLALERPVALKIIARELADRDGFRERFLRESRLAARLEHPAVVPIYDSREVEGELIVAMRLVEGGDLRRLIDAEGPLPPERAIDLLDQVAEALDAAHEAGIVHRDVKPHNVLIEGKRAFLTDFGLAKAVDESGVAGGASVVGTAAYMSPEQWRGEEVGPAADVYSLGCVLYEALTGIVPYARAEAEAEPEMPEGLGEVIERAVSGDPRRRYPTAGSLIATARQRQGSEVRPTAVLSPDSAARTTAPLGGRRLRIGPLGGGTLAIAAVGVAAAIALVLVLTLGGEGVEVSAPIPVGRAPLRIAADRDGVWATSRRDGTLTRLDPVDGSPIGRPIELGRGISGVALGAGAVWVTDPSRGELLRVDPDSGAVRQRIAVGGRPGAVVFGGDRIWVADDRGAGITVVNAPGGRVYRRDIGPHSAPLRLAVGAGALWVTSAGGGTLRRIGFATLGQSEPIPVGRGPAGVTVAGGLVWVANSRSDTVTRVDPSIQGVLGAPTEVEGRPGGIDGGTRIVWVASAADGTVTRVDIDSGDVEGSAIDVGPEPGAVAVGARAVWVANNGDGTVNRIEP